MAIDSRQRFSVESPCPVCGGHDRLPRGAGQRCSGFLAEDGRVALCTREEHAGGLAPNPKTTPPAYPHRLAGECGCGRSHGAAQLPATGKTQRAKGDRLPSGRIDCTYDYRDGDGHLVYQVVRWVPKDFRPRKPDGRGGWIWKLNGTGRIPYRLEQLLKADRESIVWICEGEKDADTLAARNLVATTNPGGTGQADISWRGQFVEYLRERRCVILPDFDDEGQHWAQLVAQRIHGLVRSVKVVNLPGLKERGDDVTDWLRAGGTVAHLVRLADQAPPWQPGASTVAAAADELPEIDVSDVALQPDKRTGRLDARVAANAWAALERANRPEFLFRRGGLPVRLERNDSGRPVLKELTADRMRHELTRAGRWFRVQVNKKTGERDNEWLNRPPLDLVKDVLASRDLPLPVLTRIVEAPVFGRDGSLLTTPGYHQASATYYAPPASLELPAVPDRPTEDQVARARSLLLDDLFVDFPFPSASDRAHAVALLLLPFARDLVDGPTPAHLIEAAAQGSGKSLLVDVALLPAVGPAIPTIGQPADDVEWSKLLTAKLLDGPPAILIDNVTKTIESAELARALTTPVWGGRLLGASATVELPVRCVWALTGNNPTFGPDMVRRFVRCRLDPDVDQPFLRPKEQFKHENLRGWAAEHRGELIWAALVLIQSWLRAGGPRFRAKTLGSYEGWAETIGGILEHAGIEGFLGNVATFLETADVEGNVWRDIVGAWWEEHRGNPVKAADLFPLAKEAEGLYLKGNDDLARTKSLAHQIKKQLKRVYGPWRIELVGRDKRVGVYALVAARSTGSAALIGSNDEGRSTAEADDAAAQPGSQHYTSLHPLHPESVQSVQLGVMPEPHRKSDSHEPTAEVDF